MLNETYNECPIGDTKALEVLIRLIIAITPHNLSSELKNLNEDIALLRRARRILTDEFSSDAVNIKSLLMRRKNSLNLLIFSILLTF